MALTQDHYLDPERKEEERREREVLLTIKGERDHSLDPRAWPRPKTIA
jgi:hypothetical protein